MDRLVRIAVMGMTGAGKSTFIKTLIPDADIAIGNDMNSQTTDPEAFMTPIRGTIFELVDTPGFGDTRRSDEEVLQCITEYLAARHRAGELFHGIIYLHSLSHTRVSGSMMAQIRAFKAICGTVFFARLVIGTTFWETETDLSTALRRETQLFSSDGVFEDVLDLGAQTTRVFRTREACLEAIQMIPRDEPVPLQVSLELNSDGDFNHTSAAAVLSPEQPRRQQEHEERLRQEAEAAERERQERARRAAEEEARRARELADAEAERLLELARRQEAYVLEQRRRRLEEERQILLRRLEEQRAEEIRREAERTAILIAEAQRRAEQERQEEEERMRQEQARRADELRQMRVEEELKQQRLEDLEWSRKSYQNWHISWYHDRRRCFGIYAETCSNDIRDGMMCWNCEAKICFRCYNRYTRLSHYQGCVYH